MEDIGVVTKVEDSGAFWSVALDDGLGFWLSKEHDVKPKAGDSVRLHKRGSLIRGVDINGHKVFYKIDGQLDREHEEWVRATKKEYAEEYNQTMEEIKDEEPFETMDISGMGGGYERTCQMMLLAGRKYLEDNPKFIWDFKHYEHIYGVCWSDSEYGKALDKVLMGACNNDCSGAMHQVVIGHLQYIHKNGYGEWLGRVPGERRYTYPSGLPQSSFGKEE